MNVSVTSQSDLSANGDEDQVRTGGGRGARLRAISIPRLAVTFALVLLTATSFGCGDDAARRQRRVAAHTLEIRQEQLRASAPSRASTAALEADKLDASPATQLGMLDVSTTEQGVAHLITTHRGPVLAATRTKTVAVSSGADGYLRTWDARSGLSLGEVPTPVRVVRLAASDALDSTVVGLDAHGRLWRWDLSDAMHPRAASMPGRSRHTVALGLSPNGATVLVVSTEGDVHRWDLASGAPLPTLEMARAAGRLPWRHKPPRIQAAVLDTDKYDPQLTVTVVTADGGVAAVDLTAMTGRTVLPAGRLTAPATSVATIPYADFGLVIGTTQGTRWWNAGTHTLTAADDGTRVTAVAADDNGIFIAGQAGVERVPDKDAPYSNGSDFAGAAVRDLQVTGSGTVTANADGTIGLLGDDSVGTERDAGPSTATVASGPHRTLLVSDGADPNHVDHLALVRLDARRPDPYDWGRARHVYRPAPSWWPHGDGASTHWFVSGALVNSRFVIAAGQDPTGIAVVLVWNAQTARPLARLALSTGGVQTSDPSIVTGLSLSHDGQRLAAYNPVQESFAVFSTKDWRRTGTIYVGRLDDFSTSTDGRTMLVASGAEDGTRSPTARTALRFIDLDSGRVKRTVATRGDHLVAYSPDGKSLAVLVDGTLRLLSTDAEHQQADPVRVETQNPSGLAWRPDSELIAIARDGGGGTILVDPHSGQTSVPLKPPAGASPTSLEWTDDGGELIAGNIDDSATPPAALRPSIWNLSSGALRARMCALGASTPPLKAWRMLVASNVSPKTVCERRTLATAKLNRAPSQPVIAYRSKGHLWVADASGRRHVIDEASPDSYPVPGFVWSPGGAIGWVQDGRAHLLRGGKANSWACACSSVAFDGENLEAVDADAHGVLRLGPAAVRMTRVAGLPPVQPTLLAARGTTEVVAGFTESPDRSTPSGLWIVHGDRAGRFAAAKSGALDRPPVTSPDGERVAVSFGTSGGACYTVDTVGIIDVRTRRVSYPTMPKAQNYSRLVRSLSWPLDGPLQSVVAPVGCAATNRPTTVEPAGSMLTLRSGALAPTGTTGYDRLVGRGVVATVAGPVRGGSSRGSLRLDAGHGSKTLAADADAVSVRP